MIHFPTDGALRINHKKTNGSARPDEIEEWTENGVLTRSRAGGGGGGRYVSRIRPPVTDDSGTTRSLLDRLSPPIISA